MDEDLAFTKKEKKVLATMTMIFFIGLFLIVLGWLITNNIVFYCGWSCWGFLTTLIIYSCIDYLLE